MELLIIIALTRTEAVLCISNNQVPIVTKFVHARTLKKKRRYLKVDYIFSRSLRIYGFSVCAMGKSYSKQEEKEVIITQNTAGSNEGQGIAEHSREQHTANYYFSGNRNQHTHFRVLQI